jgi:hypothetical protein
MDLPLFELTINDTEESGVDFIALVKRPAIEVEWLAFSQDLRQEFKGEIEKRIISGAAMIPNLPILRKAKDGSFYNVFFKAETIEKIVEKFFRQDYGKNFNKNHTSEMAEGVYLIESFIINSERGIVTPKGFDKMPDGTWWISCKVDNEEIWNEFIKTGEFNGFSVEGFFKHNKSEDEELIEALMELITNSKLNNIIHHGIKIPY